VDHRIPAIRQTQIHRVMEKRIKPELLDISHNRFDIAVLNPV
jgi:hypothetical protein